LYIYIYILQIIEQHADPSMSLLTYLREKIRLCGTKSGCNEGGCGSCTVMVSKFDHKKEKIKHYSVNACLTPIGTLHGLAVTTVEGIGSTKTRLHPVQERIAKAHGSQCGFCTPGFVMSMYTLLRNNPEPTMEEIEENLVGNLCRCTGYRPILEGFRTFTKDFRSSGCGRKDCCQLESNKETETCKQEIKQTSILFDPKDFAPYHPSQDLIFPPDLRIQSEQFQSQNLLLKGKKQIFHKTASMEILLKLKHDYPEANLMIGHTMKGIMKYIENDSQYRVLYPVDVPKMTSINITESYVEIGAATTISDNEFFKSFKHSSRRGKDLSIVNTAMKVTLDFPSLKIVSMIVAIGGISKTTIMADKTMSKVVEQTWDENFLETGISLLIEETKSKFTSFDNLAEYKTALVASFFFKFYLFVCEEIHKKFPQLGSPLKLDEADINLPFMKRCTKWMQFFQDVPEDQEKIDPVGRPIPHVSSLKQTTGEATYVDDIPSFENELHAALVLSEKARAKIVSIDPSEALKMEGVEGFFSAKDLTETQNKTGFVFTDEEVFASKEVHHIGQVIGVVVATDKHLARKAAKKVHVSAIEENSVWEPFAIESGNIEKGFENSKHILEGESRIEGQEHFYLETNGHIVIPSEDGEIEIIGSMQGPSCMQDSVSKLLRVQQNRVTCKTKRIGGAFGGKESRSIARPVRSILTRAEDMMMTGGRHPILGQMENRIDNVRILAQCCKTNLSSNSAFRGFGAPQSVFVMESIMSQVAEYLNKSKREVTEKNLYPKTNSVTPFGQELTNVTVRDCWDQVISSSNFEERKNKVNTFNRNNRYKKRGISLMPLKFCVGFPVPFLCQGGALVHIYLDGSVLISHGGAEFGQGLHTKILQIASRVLKIPISRIYIAETNTSKVPNASSTAGSVSSDLYGMAVLDACKKILTTLAPYRNDLPQKTWEEAVSAAYMDRVSLSATGHFRMEGVSEFNFKDGKPASPFIYYSYGASVSEVEINCLTGEHTVLRTDIVMDVGKSLNPAIDIGQIEGAFAQGYGLYTLEQLRYSSSGELLTKGPNGYKIPTLVNIPREFNVTLLRDSVNEHSVYSSKAIGEPPLLMGLSVFLAIREAVKAARKEDKLSIQFDSPATSERIRMACKDWITNKISNKN
ncbi:Xanthine dehydrogenase, partial [Armadillidium vulgare]